MSEGRGGVRRGSSVGKMEETRVGEREKDVGFSSWLMKWPGVEGVCKGEARRGVSLPMFTSDKGIPALEGVTSLGSAGTDVLFARALLVVCSFAISSFASISTVGNFRVEDIVVVECELVAFKQ